MSAKTLFVINPISGGNNKTSLTKTIKSWAQSSAETIEIWETTGNNDKQKLVEKISAFDPQKVVSVGGDGTVLLCASALMNSKTLLGIIPRGSANGLATELDLPEDIEDCLDIITKGKSKRCDMLMFNDQHPAIHISDIGLNAGLVKRFEDSGRRGFLGYAQGVLGQLKESEPFTVKVTTEKETIEEECVMLAFGNAKRYGTGAILNNKGKLNDGLMELSFLHSFNIPSIAGHFLDIVNDDSEHMSTVQCKEATVETSIKIPFQIDGEYQGEINHLKVSIVPSCLSIIIP